MNSQNPNFPPQNYYPPSQGQQQYAAQQPQVNGVQDGISRPSMYPPPQPPQQPGYYGAAVQQPPPMLPIPPAGPSHPQNAINPPAQYNSPLPRPPIPGMPSPLIQPSPHALNAAAPPIPQQPVPPASFVQPALPVPGPPLQRLSAEQVPPHQVGQFPQTNQFAQQQPSSGTPIVGQPVNMDLLRKYPKPPVSPPVQTQFIRATMNKFPRTSAILAKTKASIGLTVTPYPKNSSFEIPVINGTIVRCRHCRTYLNPYVDQVDQGARWRCNSCQTVNDYPPQFDVDANGQYVDRRFRPELTSPVYEFIASSEYMVRPPQPPAYLFLIDTTHLAVSSGMVTTAARIILQCLDQLPNSQENVRIAIMSVDSAIHFYNLSSANSEPRSLIVPDLQEITIPCRSEDLLVNLNECRGNIEAVLTKLGDLFKSTQKAVPAYGSALNAAINLVGSNGGKVIGLLSSLPSIGEGALTNRDDPKLYGTTKESGLLNPANSFYKLLATECAKLNVCVDLFLFPSSYIDVASLTCISKYTGGQVFMYPNFNASRSEDAIKFAADFSSFLEADIGLEAVLRIRCSTGLAISTYHGSFFYRSSDLLALPNVNPDQSFTAQVVIEDSLPMMSAGVQAAFLHTSCSGERRIRVINSSYPVSDDPRDIIQWIDSGAMVDLITKIALEKTLSSKLEDGREALLSKVVDLFVGYRNASGIGQNQQLQVCDSLRSIPLLALGALKTMALRPTSSVPVDIRAFLMNLIKCNAIEDNVYLFCPYLLPLHLIPPTAGEPDAQTGEIVLPPALNLGSDRIERAGVYLVDDGRDIVFYVGSQANHDMVAHLFGQPYHQLSPGPTQFPELENPLSKRINNIFRKLSAIHRTSPRVYLVREGDDQLRGLFFSRLIEDRQSDSLPQYSQWLSTIREKSNPAS